jgi:phosphoglycolate phosphatase
MTCKAVLFDLDGTLLDTLADLAGSMNRVLERANLPPHPVDAYRYFVGDGVVNLVRRALPTQQRTEASIQRFVQQMRQEYARRWDRKTRPYEGVCDLLDALAARGTKMAVLSNKPHDFTALCVRKLLPGGRFDFVQGVADGVPPKPDPTGARRVREALDVPAAEFVYLGDTNTDMKTAGAAGMLPVGALWGFRTAEELNESGAKVLLARPGDLLDLL